MGQDRVVILKDGRRLGFVEYGSLRGFPIFLFHGWPSSRLRVASVIKAARKSGVRLICIDRPGYGLSDYKKGRKILDWPCDVVELADQLKITKFSVYGVSGGGPYAAVCAYKIPERIIKAGIAVGLAPIYAPGVLEGMNLLYRIGWSNYSRIPFLAILGSLYIWVVAKYFPKLISLDDLNVADQREAILEAYRQGVRAAAQDLILYTADWGFDISRIKAKVFLWYGGRDKAAPVAMGKYYAEMIPTSTFKVYPDEGHILSITHAEEIFNTLTRF